MSLFNFADGDDEDYTSFLNGATITPSDAVDAIFANADSDDDWYLVTSNDTLNGISVVDSPDQDEITPLD